MANSISGKALAGSTVVLTGTATASTTAGPTGAWSFTGLAAGAYVITPSKRGFVFTPSSSSQTIVATDISGLVFLGQPVGSQGSTYTLQNVVDRVKGFGDIEPVLNVGGFSLEPAITIGSDVMTAICATPFPHKWNSVGLPLFYTWSWQQDYALVNPDGSSVYDVEWLEEGTAINISSNAVPKPWCRVEAGRSLSMRTGTYSMNSAVELGDPGFIVSTLPNGQLYYGVWGQPNVNSSTLGNNPQAGSIYTGPLATQNQPVNPIGQIVDSNGNYLVITTFGTEGINPPVAVIGALPGTTVTGTDRGDASTTVWTVVDPIGTGIRIIDVPSQTGVVWQFNVFAQMPPVKFADLDQLLAPLPDKYEPFFRAGFVAQCYRYSPEAKVRAKFKEEWPLWLKSLNDMRVAEDRELEEHSFLPDRTIMGGGRGRGKFRGAAWPFNYPR